MTVVLVHGLGQTADSWASVKKTLNVENLRIVNFDLAKKNGDVTYSYLYHELVQQCDRLEKVDLVGLSLGGVMCINYAIDFPDKVKSLVIVNGQYKMPKLLLTIQNLIFRLLPKRFFSGSSFSKSDWLSICREIKQIDFTDDLSKISAKTLVIHGEKDKVNRKASLELQEIIQNSQFVTIENAGHEINLENPEALSKVLNQFYDEQRNRIDLE